MTFGPQSGATSTSCAGLERELRSASVVPVKVPFAIFHHAK